MPDELINNLKDKNVSKKFIFFIVFLFVFSGLLPFEETTTGGGVALLMVQLAVIVIFAKIFGNLFSKISLPSVLGEIFAGIVIGPYILGSVGFWGFSRGLFPMSASGLPISESLYSISTLASIILLFSAGLETDLSLIAKVGNGSYSKLVGKFSLFVAGDVIISFVVADLIGCWYFDKNFMDPTCLFLGILATATSIGATARIIAEKKKLNSQEGVTILSVAVLDDVVGIIMFAIVLGMVTSLQNGNAMNWDSIFIIGLKAVGVWIGFTSFGIIFAHKISKILKFFKNKYVFSSMAFALALLMGGIFEKAGLAMIIGAYVTGLSLSKTDISHTILDSLELLRVLFVPIFFFVVGMMVDVNVFFQNHVLVFGLIFSIGAILSKLAGCSLPALLLGFNKLGAARIGFGMVPRGEVTVIIAGIGLAGGYISPDIFGSSIILVLVTTTVASPFISRLFENNKDGIVCKNDNTDTHVIEFNFAGNEFTKFLTNNIIGFFEQEGYYTHFLILKQKVYYIKKDEISIKLTLFYSKIKIETQLENIDFVKALVNEAITNLVEEITLLKQDISNQREILKPTLQRKKIVINKKSKLNLKKFICKDAIITHLKGNNKMEIITQMVKCLEQKGILKNANHVLQAILVREKTASTALGNFACFPHAKTSFVEQGIVSIGIKSSGIDADSMDGRPTKIFILLISSKKVNSPHIQLLTQLAQKVDSLKKAEEILKLKDKEEIFNFFVN